MGLGQEKRVVLKMVLTALLTAIKTYNCSKL